MKKHLLFTIALFILGGCSQSQETDQTSAPTEKYGPYPGGKSQEVQPKN